MFEVKLAFAAGIAALTAAVCTAGAPETVPGYFVQTGSQWRGQGSRVPVSISGSAVQIGAAILSHEGAQDRMPAPEITGAARWYGHGEAKMTRLAVRLRWRYLYPGIDLLMRFEGGSLKSDYLVEPGADPAAIRIRIEGPEAPVLDAGDLLLGEHRQAAPVAWQDHPDGRRISVQAAWKLEGSVAGFRIGPHDPTLPLVIDPYTIAFAKWLGGSALDTIRAITRDSAGNVYVGGVTESADFPSGSLRPRDIGAEAFVIKLDAANNIVWATWLGGYAHDEVTAVAAHHAGGVVVGGYTSSPDFPTANAAWPSWRGGSTDAFAIRLDSAGALVFSTFLGGAGTDKAWGVAVPAGQALWVVGETDSGDFPSLGEISGAARGGTEAFATRLSVHGSPLSSTKLGGSGADRAYAAATDAASELYITGTTESVDFPVVAPFQAASAGAPDAFVAKLAWDGSVLRYSSYLGGPPRETALPEEGSAIAVDGSGAAWVGGTTASFAFPRVAALQQTFGGGVTDAFIARVAPGGTSLLFSTYIGGNGTDQAAAVALGSDAVWIAGSTTSTDLPVTAQAQSGSGSSWDGFVAAYSHGSNSRVYSGYLGGSGSDTITAAAASGTSLFLAGNSSSVALLSTGSPRGLIDGYIARLDTLPSAVQITPSVTSGRYGVAGAGCEPGTYSGTRVFTWAHNATCTVTVPSPQTTGGTRLSFTGWSDGATQNPRTISVNSTSAQFFPNFSVEQQLTMAVAPAGAGTSASSPSPAGGWYPQGSTVTLTAQPASGYRFSNWSGSTASSSGTVSFAITSAGAVTANFACAYTLTSGTAVNAAQVGGSYTINVSTGAGCAWTASGASWVTISSGTAGAGNGSVTIAVAANSGPSRSVAINVAGQVVTVTQNTTASYATSIEGVAWTVTGSGCQPGSYAGTKTLTWTAGSSCTVAMSNSVATDTRTVFVQWQDGSTASSRVFVASSSATYKATYKTEHRVQAAAGPGGSVTPAGTSWHVAGSTATITAVPVSGYRFAGWTGSITAQANPLSMAVTGPLTVSASFAADVVPVTIDGVSWTTSGAGCSAGSYAGKQTLNWVRNAACTVAMNAATAGETRQAFTKWLDGPTTSTRIITATPGAAYSATYRTEYRVLVSLSTGGSATPTESWHVPGATVTLSATAQPGYRFRRWLGALNTVANPVQVQVDAPLSILAAFTRMCNFAIAPGSVTMEWRGGQGTFQLTGEACEWDATSTATWVDFFPIKGTGPGQVGYTVYPNMSGLTRTAQIQVGTAVMTVTQKPSGISNQRRFLQVLYYNFMNRLPSDQEIANWETHLNGGVPRYVIAESFLNSPEFAQGGKYVAGLYVGLLNRDAEYTGWLFIRGAMISAVVSPDGLVNNFITSEEFLLNNGSLSDEDYIRMLYRQALGRTGGAGEVTGWVQTMRTPPNNRVVVGRSFLRSPEFVAGAGARLTTFLLYATLLARDPSKAERALMIDRISHGTPVSTLIAELIDSAEFSALLQ